MKFESSGRHEPNDAVKRVKGGVDQEEQGGQEGGLGEAHGDDSNDCRLIERFETFQQYQHLLL